MKILAIASAGGHWIQLLRLGPAFEGHELMYLSTKPDFGKMVEEHQYFHVPDANRNSKMGLIKNFFSILRIVQEIKPDLIITTGAAPGLMGIVAGRFTGAKTIWVDSIANVEELSLSGKLAGKIANKVYTQWPDLANKKVVFSGNVLS